MPRDDSFRHDLRLVPVAAAGWGGAWLGTGLGPFDRWTLTALVAATLTVLALLAAAVRWRIAVAGAAALSLLGAVSVAGLIRLAMHRTHSSDGCAKSRSTSMRT